MGSGLHKQAHSQPQSSSGDFSSRDRRVLSVAPIDGSDTELSRSKSSTTKSSASFRTSKLSSLRFLDPRNRRIPSKSPPRPLNSPTSPMCTQPQVMKVRSLPLEALYNDAFSASSSFSDDDSSSSDEGHELNEMTPLADFCLSGSGSGFGIVTLLPSSPLNGRPSGTFPRKPQQSNMCVSPRTTERQAKLAFTEHECCICCEAVRLDSGELCDLECGHVFHKSCVDPWLDQNSSCPMCRAKVSVKFNHRRLCMNCLKANCKCDGLGTGYGMETVESTEL
eukprot:NODE_1038_length_1929_cov_115.573643_g987_i0.p1 GENE.NODE_1038_length_1929_cov_115.573643_g987_i0~~NODE_1038_length_1929_cov_115.573643_g987_i0.p1  ORF type:complete len:279 (+),score=17.05 NODE_1038_length_1929_cov_115.573643_g987_i0:92-928(+)